MTCERGFMAAELVELDCERTPFPRRHGSLWVHQEVRSRLARVTPSTPPTHTLGAHRGGVYDNNANRVSIAAPYRDYNCTTEGG